MAHVYMKDTHTKVEDFVACALHTNDSGALENASRNADSALDAVGRLCQVLANKGLLTGDEVHYIANGWFDPDYPSEFS